MTLRCFFFSYGTGYTMALTRVLVDHIIYIYIYIFGCYKTAIVKGAFVREIKFVKNIFASILVGVLQEYSCYIMPDIPVDTNHSITQTQSLKVKAYSLKKKKFYLYVRCCNLVKLAHCEEQVLIYSA